MHRRVTFVAKAEYFDDPKTAWFFQSCGQIPIRREGGTASERALASATEVLRNGKVFGIYPEGTRTATACCTAATLAWPASRSDARSPIVPIGFVGTDDVQPIDSRLPKLFRRVTIRFGEPINPTRYSGRENDRMALRELTDEVMYEIAQLSGYEYVDTYATKTAEDIPTDTAHIASFADARTPESAAS